MTNLIEAIVVANSMLIVGWAIMWAFEFAGKHTRFRHAYKLRLNLAVAALCATTLPIILAPISGVLSTLIPTNVDDFVVQQYLSGNIGLSATQVADVLSVKENSIEYVANSYFLVAGFIVAALCRLAYLSVNIVRAFKLISSADQVKSTKRVSVRVSSDTVTPFSSRGLFKYYIVLPSSITDDKKATNIALGHEAQHIRQHDVTLEILITLLSPVFVLNPAFWLISDRIRRFREYSCDAAFLEKARCKKKDYCLLLLDIASRASKQKQTAMAGSVPFWGREGTLMHSNKSALHQRIIALATEIDLNTKFLRKVNLIPAILLIIASAATVAFVSKPVDWSHERIMLSTVINLESLNRINNGFGLAITPSVAAVK